MNYSCLYHFDSPDVLLLEVRVLELPAETPIQHRLHWLLVNKDRGIVSKLTFVSMSKEGGESRQFAEGSLNFNEASAEYYPALSAQVINLNVEQVDSIQPVLARAVGSFLGDYLESVNITSDRDRSHSIQIQP